MKAWSKKIKNEQLDVEKILDQYENLFQGVNKVPMPMQERRHHTNQLEI